MFVLDSNNQSNNSNDTNKYFLYFIYLICFFTIWGNLSTGFQQNGTEESQMIDMSHYGVSSVEEVLFKEVEKDIIMRIGSYSTVYTPEGSLMYDVTFKIDGVFKNSVLNKEYNEFVVRLPEDAITEEQLSDRSTKYEGTLKMTYLIPNLEELEELKEVSEEDFVNEIVMRGKWLSDISSIEFMYSGYIDDGVYSKENSENVITEYLKSLDDENIENTNK